MTRPTTLTSPDGVEFRDLNGNGVMDPYEDPRLPVDERVADLVRRLSLSEKAGLLFQSVTNASATGALADEQPKDGRAGTRALVEDRLITHINLHWIPDPGAMARWGNEVQALAERSPHGIPVTFSTDPRHSFIENFGASFTSDYFSAWPEPIGLGAIGDPDLVREFARIARAEYTAVGLRAAMHPTVDLATEPRWARQYSTFGADAATVAALAKAYIDGFEGDALGSDSVACMAKHFPGGGPQRDGEDPHFPYGREQVYPGGLFEHHLEPFREVIARGVSAIMPYYGVPVDLTWRGRRIEEVGFGFNKQIITGLLREEIGFGGVICTDWGLITESRLHGRRLPARAWGVEHLSVEDRMLKVLDAGCDQFGGEESPDVLVRLVEAGRLDERRLDESVARLLKVKFELGLFENPYVDEQTAPAKVGTPEYRAAGEHAQAASMVLIREEHPVLPVADGTTVYLDGLSSQSALEAGLDPTDDPAAASVAVIRIAAPFEPRDEYMLEAAFRAGSLEFGPEVVGRIAAIAASVPVVLVVQLDRPAIVTPLLEHSAVVIGDFGASDAAVLRVLKGQIVPAATLPFELPSSMAAVEASFSDVPGGSSTPIATAGTALRWPAQAPADAP
jgi:beta-glucosidase